MTGQRAKKKNKGTTNESSIRIDDNSIRFSNGTIPSKDRNFMRAICPWSDYISFAPSEIAISFTFISTTFRWRAFLNRVSQDPPTILSPI